MGRNIRYHQHMRTFETPYAADWFAISLRWASILGLAVALGLGHALTAVEAWPLAILTLWNMAMTILASMNARLWQHRYINLAVDVVVSAAFFRVQGGLGGPASWAGLLPILTSAIYFELTGALVVAGLFALLGFLTSELYFKAHSTLVFIWLLSALGLGGLFGWLGAQLARRLRGKRQAWLDAEEGKRRVQGDRLRAIYELTSTLTATLSYKRVLDSALDMSYSALNPNSESTAPDPLISAVLLFRGGQLRVGSARRFTNADSKVAFDGSEGILKRVFDEGEPIFTNEIASDPELGRVIALRNCLSAYCFPLRSGFNVYGAMLYAHPDPDYFTPVRRDLLDIIGRQAVIAVQNARLYQDLVEEKERMIEVHEEARKKLARDLHDGPTQSVAALAMRLNVARRMMTQDVKAATEEITRIEELAHRTSKEIRHMLFTLRPLILESEGLKAALKSMSDKMSETFNQTVIIDVDDEIIRAMEMGKQGVIFYIIEEAVGNARKHANAANIWVRLRPFQPSVALLEVEDDGVGFDLAAVDQSYDKRSSLGMVNLRERSELVNGLLDIKSTIGKGTKVSVYIPLTGEAADRLQHARAL
jgi:signal transduction histidine kinase